MCLSSTPNIAARSETLMPPLRASSSSIRLSFTQSLQAIYSARAFLPIEPRIQVGCTKAPHLSNVGAVDLSTPCQLLKSLVMNVQELCGLITVEEGFKIRNAE